ncbi:MAG: hypothetical protein MUC96_14985 [Myxococcaceae bacterium]|nr:hypothetical protein [Myxococcaceae bacterium]
MNLALSEEQVLAIVQQLMSEPTRRRRRNSESLQAYVIERLSQNDAEWASFMSARADWQKELEKWLRPRDV